MRISIFIIAVSSVLLLTDCGKTMDSRLAGLEKGYGSMPAGYTPYQVPMPPPVPVPVYTSAPVAVPAPVTESKPAVQMEAKAGEEGELAWNKIGGYDAVHPTLPVKAAGAGASVQKLSVPLLYDDVTVFPVDGDVEPYQDMKYDFTRVAGSIPDTDSGSLPVQTAQQVFFSYGSARVESGDRQRLKNMAAKIIRTDREYRVNVVGHASKRVDHVMDPVRRKMINFIMAQKRANAVTQQLSRGGLSPDWVMAASKGDAMPNLHPGSRTQEAADRRVDVYVETGNQTYR